MTRRRRKRKPAATSPSQASPPATSRRWIWLGITALLVAVGLWAVLQRESWNEAATVNSSDKASAHYVGRAGCAECHAEQQAAWTGSHHDLAMQEATEATVLGDFRHARFSYAGVTTEFFRRDGKFVVRTDGADGKLSDFTVRYTFGVEPLQQYLIEFPGGRLQALSIAWDSRPPEQGGQRWFHLYPGESIDHQDELHWTGPQQNWNYMCAECHSTNLQRNYDAAKRSYSTSWSEIDVSCEACHGPGSRHVDWAKHRDAPRDDDVGRSGTRRALRRASRNRLDRRFRERQAGSEPARERRTANSKPARVVIPGAARSGATMSPAGRLAKRIGWRCSIPGSISRTDRFTTRSMNTGRSCKAGCIRPASPAVTVMIPTARNCGRRAAKSA